MYVRILLQAYTCTYLKVHVVALLYGCMLYNRRNTDQFFLPVNRY